MVLELHIFGPAFGVPSIDADCLAAVIYLQQCLPSNTWKLVPSNDPDRNPFRQLPAIYDQSTWVAGFRQIVQYLRDKSVGEWDLDANLNKQQRADNEAYHSFIHARGLPLLDLSFYVSSDNFTNYTRAAWAELLSWPESWIIPQHKRGQAKKRTEHLGLNALDVDAAQEKENQQEGLLTQIPKSLRKPKQTVMSLLEQNAHSSRFRLDAVTADFLEPVQEKLGNHDWLMGDGISSADCMALAYLILMQAPELPQSWLRDAMMNKYMRLGQWAAGHALLILGVSVSPNSVLDAHTSKAQLPWSTPPIRSWTDTGMIVVEKLISSAPILRFGYLRREMSTKTAARADRYQERDLAYRKMRNQQTMYSQVVTLCISGAAASVWLFHIGILSLPQHRAPTARKSFGDAGRLLGLR